MSTGPFIYRKDPKYREDPEIPERPVNDMFGIGEGVFDFNIKICFNDTGKTSE